MDTNKILQADLLDIVFDGKNKQYGAYVLRKSYNKRLLKSLLITATVVLLLFCSAVFANIMGNNKNDTIEVADVEMTKLKNELTPIIPPPPPVISPAKSGKGSTGWFESSVTASDRYGAAPKRALRWRQLFHILLVRRGDLGMRQH